MDFRKPELILVLFVTFIVASYVELNFGGFGSSGYLALIFFIISLILLSRLLAGLRGDRQTRLKASKKSILLGSVIIIADILYNLKTGSSIQTLDTMLIFLGISLVFTSVKNDSASSMGRFGVYFSSIFLLLFLIVYVIPSRLGSSIYDYYGYYAITLPAMFIWQSLGFSLHLDSLTTFHVYGIEDIYYKIDLGCFGFYSMILIVSTVLAYRLILPSKNPPSLVKVTVILIIASYLANLLRVLSLVSIGYYYGFDTMLIFHTFLGWALFVVIVLPMAYVYLK
ncbi:MAG: archaeosortase C [Candidatus Methanoperedens sp.]|nr:archaeosortase C [Candidatus Methanoperedens sp.]